MDLIILAIELTVFMLFAAFFICLTRESVLTGILRWKLGLTLDSDQVEKALKSGSAAFRFVDRYASFVILTWFLAYAVSHRLHVQNFDPIIVASLVAATTGILCVIWFEGFKNGSDDSP